MATETAEQRESPADKKWGFTFGVDGTLTINEAVEFAKVSRRSLYRLMDDGSIRRGKPMGHPRICLRSLRLWLATKED